MIFLLTLVFFLFFPSSSLAFDDFEDRGLNQISTPTLDFSVSPDPLFDISNFVPGDTIPAAALLQNQGTLPFNYQISTQDTGSTLCSFLTLSLSVGSSQVYSHSVHQFQSPPLSDLNPQFEISFAGSNPVLQGQTCQFSLVFEAWQTNLSPGIGFTDQETLSASVSTGCWDSPSVPEHIYPPNNHIAAAGSAWDLNPYMDWADSNTTCPLPNTFTYQYESYFDENLIHLAFRSGWLSSSQIPAPGTPDGTYYWRVRAQDNHGNISDFSSPWKLTVDRNHPQSQITSTQDLSSSSTFTINYQAEDNFGIDHVKLYYSFNLGGWQYFGSDVPNSPGSFDFNSPQGNGLYQFYTQAVDLAGNQEDTAGKTDNPYQVQVDTQPPFTNLSLGYFGPNRFAFHEQTRNGNFQDTSDPQNYWTFAGDGQHQVVDDAGNQVALLGWRDFDPAADGQDYAYQVLPLPTDDSTLSFWYRVISNDTVDYDYFEAKIIDDAFPDNQETIIKTGSGEIGGWWADSLWQEITYPLNNWLGSTIRLWFGVNNTGSLATHALVDDVRVTSQDNFVAPDHDLNLAANDTGSGLDTTYYQVGDSGPWQPYLGATSLSAEGVADSTPVSLNYYSTDLAGNQEATKSIQLTANDSDSFFKLVLNTISPRPSGSDSGSAGLPLDGEWVEIYNNSDSTINVDGFYFEESAGGRLIISSSNTASTLIGPNSALQVFRNGDSDFNLNDAGDTVKFFTSSGQLIDSYTYGPVAVDDKTWRRLPDGTGAWADPHPPLPLVAFSQLLLSPPSGLYQLVWLINPYPPPEPDSSASQPQFQPVDITGWQICYPDPSLPKYNPQHQEYDPEPTADICQPLSADLNPNPDLSPQEKVRLSPQDQRLYIISLDKLNPAYPRLFLLKPDNQIVDSLTFEDTQKIIKRDNDFFSWKVEDPSSDLLSYYLYPRQQGSDINLKIYGITTSISVEITYLSNGLEKGIFDQVSPQSLPLEKQYYLGTCSRHGVCTPDPQVSDINYNFTLNP